MNLHPFTAVPGFSRKLLGKPFPKQETIREIFNNSESSDQWFRGQAVDNIWEWRGEIAPNAGESEMGRESESDERPSKNFLEEKWKWKLIYMEKVKVMRLHKWKISESGSTYIWNKWKWKHILMDKVKVMRPRKNFLEDKWKWKHTYIWNKWKWKHINMEKVKVMRLSKNFLEEKWKWKHIYMEKVKVVRPLKNFLGEKWKWKHIYME